MTLGYVYLFELNDFAAASHAFRQAAQTVGAPDYLVRLSQQLETPRGRAEVGIRVIDFMSQRPSLRDNSEKFRKLQAIRNSLQKSLESAESTIEKSTPSELKGL